MHRKLVIKINKAAKRRAHGLSSIKVFHKTTTALRLIKADNS